MSKTGVGSINNININTHTYTLINILWVKMHSVCFPFQDEKKKLGGIQTSEQK